MSELEHSRPAAPQFGVAWFIVPLLIGMWIPAGCGLRPQGNATPVTPATVSPAHPQGRSSVSVDDRIIERVRRAVIRHHLLSLPLDQVTFEILRGEGPDACVVIVRENHEHGGGDPNTAPRLFSVRVDQTTGALTTDAHSLTTGEFQPLRG